MLRGFAGLVAITLAGLVLRLVDIDQWPLWTDEALTLLIAQWPVGNLLFAPVDPTPGLYYVLHHLFLGPMVGVAGARSISLLCGTLLIPAAYFLAREMRVPALLVGALVALSFPLIDYSQEARAYSLLLLLVTISAIFFIRWTRTMRDRELYLAIGSGILAFYTHLVSIFWLGPMWLAIFRVGRRHAVRPLLLFAIMAAPEVIRLIAYRTTGFLWLTQATPIQAWDTLGRTLLPFRPVGWWVAPALLLIGWRGWASRTRLVGWARENRGAAWTLLALLASPLLVWLFGFVARPIFMTRTILMGVPGFLLGIALLLKFERRLTRYGILTLYAASLFATGTTRAKEDWRPIADRAGGDALLMCQPWQGAAMKHALGGAKRVLLHYPDGTYEIGEEPWQKGYFKALTRNPQQWRNWRITREEEQAIGPVWAVRTGDIRVLGNKPTALAEASRICDSHRQDNAPRYIAE